jgi:hypothetical protein
MKRLLSSGDRWKWGQESGESGVAVNKQAEGHYIAMMA